LWKGGCGQGHDEGEQENTTLGDDLRDHSVMRGAAVERYWR
jgi:hypothetical protein